MGGGKIMKLRLSIFVVVVCTINNHTGFSTDTLAPLQDKKDPELSCFLLIRNTSPSPIWISNDSALKKHISLDELEHSNAQVIQPYEIASVNVGTTFTIYTRLPQSNTNYQQNYTIVQRWCNPEDDEYVVDFSSFESGKIDPKRFIVINHRKEVAIPESAYPLCPGGLYPELDQETEQWLCKVYRYSDVYEKHVEEYVPVLSYIYQWLPSSIWVPWYINNPQFYHWYNYYPDLYSHLPKYQAPWTTPEYATWYNQQPKEKLLNLKFPEPIQEKFNSTSRSLENPIGLPASNIKTPIPTKNPNFNTTNMPPVTVHTKEHKKQELEDIISSHAIQKDPQEAVIKPAKKPMPLMKSGTIITRSGKQKIAV